MIRWNPRGRDLKGSRARAAHEGRLVSERAGRRVAIFDEIVARTCGGHTHQARRVVGLIERRTDRPVPAAWHQ